MSADSPVAILYDNDGNPIHSFTFDGQEHLATAILQDMHEDAGNSSVANLSADGTFTGVAHDVNGIAAIRVLVMSDQIVQMKVQQSSDGTNWDVEDYWLAYPGVGEGRIVQAMSMYVRVLAQNLSSSATTYFRLHTVLCPVACALPRALTNEGTTRMAVQSVSAVPDVRNFTSVGQHPSLCVDYKGSLGVRGQVLTDEKSFRDDFTDGAISVALSGVLTFQADVYVTGNSTSFLSEVTIGDYVKLDTDGQSALTIVADVLSDTLLVLEEAYNGTPGTGTSTRANWYYQSGNGGAIGYATSVVGLSTGVVPGGHATVLRIGDYPPCSAIFVAKVNNRYANQDCYLGFMESAAHLANKMAAVRFTGTDNTQLDLVTSFDADDKEVTTITLPMGATTADYHEYRIDMSATEVSLWMDQVRLATHRSHIPGPYDTVQITAGIENLGAVTGDSTLSVDLVYFSNFNLLETALSARGEALPVVQFRAPTATVTSVSAAVADTALLAASLSRVGATIFNDSTAVCYLKLGSGASDTSFTVRMSARSYYELPYGYSGAVHGYWSAANGAARITEVR